MAAPALSIVELAEDERTVLLRANIAEGGDADLSNLVLADIANYAAVGPVAVALSIRRVWWSLENMNIELKFEADTPVKAITLSGNGSYDFEAIHGVKNPGGSGSTGSILLDTYGIAINAALGCVGSLVIELWKVRSGEAGGELDSAATSSLFTPEVPEVSGGIIVGGNSAAAGYIQFLEDSDNGSNYVQVQAPASLAGNTVLTLPGAYATTGQVLSSTDAGILSWIDQPTAASLNLEIGTDVQAYSANLTDLATNYTAASASGAASIKLYEDTDEGTNYIELKAPALAADVTLTLPTTNGDASQFLQTDGDGVLTWATVGTSLSNDTSPTLGGDLDLDVHKLITTDNKNIYIEPNGTGNVVLTDCNLVLSSGQGIDFSATANGTTMGNELFDDYEEGTWTPAFISSGATWTHSAQTGKYTKIGNLVFVYGTLTTSNVSGQGGAGLYIGGLPFSPVTGSEYPTGAVSHATGWASHTPRVVVPYTQDRLRVQYRTAVDGADAYNIDTEADGSCSLSFSLYYII